MDTDNIDLTPLDAHKMGKGITTLMLEMKLQSQQAVKYMTLHDFLIWHAISGPLVSNN